MDFAYTLSILNSNIHPTPSEHRDEVALVKKILTESQGYLTKSKPVKVVFYDDYAGE